MKQNKNKTNPVIQSRLPRFFCLQHHHYHEYILGGQTLVFSEKVHFSCTVRDILRVNEHFERSQNMKTSIPIWQTVLSISKWDMFCCSLWLKWENLFIKKMCPLCNYFIVFQVWHKGRFYKKRYVETFSYIFNIFNSATDQNISTYVWILKFKCAIL